MFQRTRVKTFVTLAAVAVVSGAVSAAAGGVTKPVEPGRTVAEQLYGRVLGPRDLRGFYPIACPMVTLAARPWAAENSVAATTLVANGFRAGLREPLFSQSSKAKGQSVVGWFRSSTAAQHELEGELAQARSAAETFRTIRVDGVPGAQGYVATRGGTSRVAVAFTQGAYEYVVAISTVHGAQIAALRDRASTALRVLYLRLQRDS